MIVRPAQGPRKVGRRRWPSTIVHVDERLRHRPLPGTLGGCIARTSLRGGLLQHWNMQYPNLGALADHAAQTMPDAALWGSIDDGSTLTYAQFAKATVRCANA